MVAVVDEILAFSLYPPCPFRCGFVLFNSFRPFEVAYHGSRDLDRATYKAYGIPISGYYDGTFAVITSGFGVFVSAGLCNDNPDGLSLNNLLISSLM